MNSSIIAAMISATATIISALISARGAILVKRGDSDSQLGKANIYLWPVTGVLLFVTITLVVLGRSYFSSKSDDFNNPLYDNSINVNLWKILKDSNCDVKQENGAAVFRLNDLSSDKTLCYLDTHNDVKWNSIGSIEAKLLAENGASGDFSLGIVELKTSGFKPDTVWAAQCGIVQTPTENKVELFFYVNNSFPEGDPEISQSIAASANTPYKMRLEVDPGTGTIQCFANDKVLGSLTPSNIGLLKLQTFNRHVVGFWSPQSAGTYKVDDLLVKP